jgi:AraC-like DNA-binding protein
MSTSNVKARRAPVSVGYARALLRHFGKSSEQRDLLLKGTGIRESVLGQPNADIPVSALVALAANITRRHGELWPLEAETVWSNALQGALDVATRTAPTVEHALATGARFGPIRAPFIRTRLSKTRGFVRLEISKAFAMEEAEWRAIALAVGLNVHVTFAQILEDCIAQTTLEFPWPPPKGVERLRPFYSCKLRFNARAFAFDVPKALCGIASPFADRELHAKTVEVLQTAASRGTSPTSLSQIVENLIALHLPRRLNEEDAARLIGMSRRTLVRRLADSSLAFRKLLDGVLRERARAMHAAGAMSRDEMAAALGYADATSFSRACRRWFRRRPKC